MDGIMNGYEVIIKQRIALKAEATDVEALDKSKADISALNSLLEKVTRLE